MLCSNCGLASSYHINTTVFVEKVSVLLSIIIVRGDLLENTALWPMGHSIEVRGNPRKRKGWGLVLCALIKSLVSRTECYYW